MVLSDNLRRYEAIELALDVSKARFTFTQHFIGVPAGHIRRNPEWHYILTIANARRLVADPSQDGIWRQIAGSLIEVELPDVVVVLGEGGSKAAQDKGIADELRKSDILT